MNKQDVEHIVAFAKVYAREQELSAVLRYLREMAEESLARCEALHRSRRHGNSETARAARALWNASRRLLEAVAALEQGAHRSPGATP